MKPNLKLLALSRLITKLLATIPIILLTEKHLKMFVLKKKS